MSATRLARSLRPGEVEPGTNVLVSGQALTGKREVLLTLLGIEARDRATIVVTTRQDADTTVRDFQALAGERPDERICVVDCVSQSGGFGAVTDSADRRYLSDPSDLTGIGIGVSEWMRECHAEGRPTRIGIHSLSTMMMYADLRRVFQFLNVVTNRVRVADFVSVVAVDDRVLDQREFGVIQQPFDAHLRPRERNGEREMQVRGGSFAPREWTPIAPDG